MYRVELCKAQEAARAGCVESVAGEISNWEAVSVLRSISRSPSTREFRRGSPRAGSRFAERWLAGVAERGFCSRPSKRSEVGQGFEQEPKVDSYAAIESGERAVGAGRGPAEVSVLPYRELSVTHEALRLLMLLVLFRRVPKLTQLSRLAAGRHGGEQVAPRFRARRCDLSTPMCA